MTKTLTQTMRKSNAANVRAYYARHKAKVLRRKVMKRCRATGAMPQVASIKAYDIPIVSLMVAFADWVANNHDATRVIARQSAKLTTIRTLFYDRVAREFGSCPETAADLATYIQLETDRAQQAEKDKIYPPPGDKGKLRVYFADEPPMKDIIRTGGALRVL